MIEDIKKNPIYTKEEFITVDEQRVFIDWANRIFPKYENSSLSKTAKKMYPSGNILYWCLDNSYAFYQWYKKINSTEIKPQDFIEEIDHLKNRIVDHMNFANDNFTCGFMCLRKNDKTKESVVKEHIDMCTTGYFRISCNVLIDCDDFEISYIDDQERQINPRTLYALRSSEFPHGTKKDLLRRLSFMFTFVFPERAIAQ